MDEIPNLDNPFGSEDWVKHKMATDSYTGEQMVKDPETGFLQRKSAIGFNAQKKVRFLELFAEDSLTVAEICKAVDVGRRIVYQHIALDPEFRKQYMEIDEAHTDQVEKMLRNQAKTNKMASSERIFYLKKKRPQIYADRIQIENKSKTDDSLKGLIDKLDDYQLIPKDSIVEVKPENQEEK